MANVNTMKSRVLKFWWALGLVATATSCTGSDFIGRDSKSAGKGDDNSGADANDVEPDTAIGNDEPSGTDANDAGDANGGGIDSDGDAGSDGDLGGSDGWVTGTDDTGALGDDSDEVRANCWVAVSGGYFGFGDSSYETAFPKTQSGNSIRHGETFDPVGGVFLNAGNETYEYGKGGKEIDKAIDLTFDGIAVTPGVNLKVWNKNGDVVLDRAGPVMLLSKDYQDEDPAAADVAPILAPDFKERLDSMPKWMQTVMKNRDYKLAKKSGMHDWTKVLVTRIPGKSCR